MDFEFPKAFGELDKRKEFFDVLYTVDKVKEKSKIRLLIAGPFIFFIEAKSPTPLFMIFIEYYQAGKVSNSTSPAVTVRSSYEDHIYYLYFQKQEDVNNFLICYYTNMTLSNSFFSSIICDQIEVADVLVVYFSKHN